MTNLRLSFESELSVQHGLSEHLAGRVLDAYEVEDADAFRYASEVHGETQTRVKQVEAARVSIRNAFEDYQAGGSRELPLGAIALGLMVLTGELKVA
ncbi:MAG: hypothetical protein JWO96_226 [Candidatus Saccharibacteria bacterium]|nr:hypothetical protein [Candidatus Saccharibacteria bacterium]